MSFGALSLKGRALRYLAQREYSRAELQRKLARYVEPGAEPPAAEQIAAVLGELEHKGLLSDLRAAESLLAAKTARLGVRRLKHLMQSRGLARELVATMLAQAQGSELERARSLWQRRFRVPATDAAARAKQIRFLMGRGFDVEIIRKVVQGSEEDA